MKIILEMHKFIAPPPLEFYIIIIGIAEIEWVVKQFAKCVNGKSRNCRRISQNCVNEHHYRR